MLSYESMVHSRAITTAILSWLSARTQRITMPLTCICLALSISFFIQVQMAFRSFPCVDEVGHLPAGISHWAFSRFDLYRVNPPLPRMIATVGSKRDAGSFDWSLYSENNLRRPEFSIGISAVQTHKLSIVRLYYIPRLVMAVCCTSGLILFAYFIWQHLGAWASVVSTWLAALSPSIICNSAIVVPEPFIVLVQIFVTISLLNWFNSPTLSNAFFTGFSLGFALLVKSTFVAYALCIPFVFLPMLMLSRKRVHKRRSLLAQTFFIFCVAIFFINCFYMFEGSFTKWGSFHFCSKALGGVQDLGVKTGNRFTGIFSDLPIPLPRNYVYGLDFLKMEAERGYWSFLLGEWKFGSWFYYYAIALLAKTTEATILLSLLGICLLTFSLFSKALDSKSVVFWTVYTLPPVVGFILVSLQGGFGHHHRYVLFIYPVLFAVASFSVSNHFNKFLTSLSSCLASRIRVFINVAIAVCVILNTTSALYVYPFYTSYVNSFFGGTANGWRVLGFSNIDWGQDLLEVRDWVIANKDKTPIVMELDYFGLDGELLGIRSNMPPVLPRTASIDEVRKRISETQWWIISVKRLYNLPDQDGLEYLQQIEPVEKIAYCYHVYRIDPLPADETSN